MASLRWSHERTTAPDAEQHVSCDARGARRKHRARLSSPRLSCSQMGVAQDPALVAALQSARAENATLTSEFRSLQMAMVSALKAKDVT